MKNEKGITLSSLIIYIVAMTIVTIIITNITRYFYANVNKVENASEYSVEYLKFIECITDEVNITENYVKYSGVDNLENNAQAPYIFFVKSYNQYTYKNGKIFKNDKEICRHIKSCSFSISGEEKNKLTINITMEDGKLRTYTFKVISY